LVKFETVIINFLRILLNYLFCCTYKSEKRNIRTMKWNLIEKQTEFLDLLKLQGKSFNTIKNYKADLNCFNAFLVDKQQGLKLNQFTTAQVQEYAQFLNKKYDSSNSVRRRVQALRLFFDFLLTENIFNENPIKKMAVSPKILDV